MTSSCTVTASTPTGIFRRGPLRGTNEILTQAFAGLAHAAACSRLFAVQGVRAHDDHPWNELADTLANHAVATRECLPGPDLATLLKLRDSSGH